MLGHFRNTWFTFVARPLIVLVLLAGVFLQQRVDAQTLQLLYNFENGAGTTVPDASGNGRAGSLGTGSVFTSDARTGATAGQTFTTSNGINVAPFDLGNQFSIFTFVKLPDVATAGNIQTIFTNSPGGFNTDGIRLFVNRYLTSNQGIHIEVGDGTNGGGIETADGVFLSDGKYHSLAFVIDRALGNGTIYFDGSQVATGSGLPTFATNTGTQTIGMFTDTEYKTNATYDEFRIYSGLLSAQQVQALNNLPAGVPEPGTLALLAGMGITGAGLMARRRNRRRA